MKRALFLVSGFSLTMAATAIARPVVSAPQDQQQTQNPPAAAPAQPTPQLKFSGFVLKADSGYVFDDLNANDLAYKIADATKVSAYENERVDITGTLDIQTQTLHVENIQTVRWLLRRS